MKCFSLFIVLGLCIAMNSVLAIDGQVVDLRLHRAAQSENLADVEKAIGEGADLDVPNVYGITPLWIACSNGNRDIAVAMLKNGADANKEVAGGESPLLTAARVGSRPIVEALIGHGAKLNHTERKGQTALMWAAAEGNTDVVDALIEAGADVHVRTSQGFTANLFAAREGRLEACQRLIEAGVDVNDVMDPKNSSGRNPRKGTSALMLAVESGHFELALWLVERGADPNDQRSGYTPLHALTWVRKTDRGDNVEGDPSPRGSGSVNSLQFVRAIVSAGADINAKLENGQGGRAKLNRKGATPFLMAAKTADLPLLELLHELGADPTLTNVDDCNALMAAAGIGVVAVGEEAGTEPEVIAVMDWLVDLGLDPNHADKNKETAMHGAAYRNYPLAVKKLTELGARPDAWNHKNTYGWTPIMVASGKRPGSFKPSPETIAALQTAIDASKMRDN
ncbi:Phosphocholine transferase AnkX [Rubripirellula tenax]|uniref:Phosphocholine transferase AnkX n=1 Tax=Rubripirellula tenax TaxID=2528015 RepID=A0A5C6EK15_9BACT|nr:ankyrin repeat domain-containing protein [Rubripirellula tenax]TWU48894.1 Phosphocholine transferase AnkX [Rubripirellula tenax]